MKQSKEEKKIRANLRRIARQLSKPPSRTRIQREARGRGECVCPACGISKSLDEFYGRVKKLKRNGVGYCKDCNRIRKLQLRYGISKDEAKKLLGPDAICGICGRKQGSRKLSSDHNHSTNELRGVLCHPCNAGIGLLRDDPELLRKALAYLDKKQQLTVLKAS